jgi:co-chaperonin GroES (HSP10)
MVEVGDRVLVESEKVGTVTRSGVVMAVDGRLITVRWDSGSQSVFVPSAGSLRVTDHEAPAGEVNSS